MPVQTRSARLVVLASLAISLAACDAIGQAGSAPFGVQASAVTAEGLRAAVSDEHTRAFYEARGWRAVWTPERARALDRALGEAARHALDRSAFLPGGFERDDPSAREADLTKATLAYADALARGRLDPAELFDIYTLPRPEVDLVAGLGRALDDDRLVEWLAELAPQDDGYRALSEAYLRYAGEAQSGEGARIGGGDTIREGDNDPRVPAIAEALRANGYLDGSGQPGDRADTRYTARIAAAIERMQEDFGIAADGVIGPDTLGVLNTGAADRARQLAVNLERRRWLERRPPPTRIDVNTAAAVLDYWRDGRHVDRRRVVVGQPGWETPQLGSPIFRLVANPSWTVPKSIEEEEIAGRGESYLWRNNMVRRDGWIVQLPGPDNALGEVKFDMRNEHAIYLHDTPAKPLFQRNQRHFSHGCVRVDGALGFARLLAEHDGITAEYERARASRDETFVPLNSNIPVRLIYQTAFPGPDGTVVFRTDPYGWDETVARALGLHQRERQRLQRHVRDIGP